jgi:hypothetical protein
MGQVLVSSLLSLIIFDLHILNFWTYVAKFTAFFKTTCATADGEKLDNLSSCRT